MIGFHIIHNEDANHMLAWLILALGRLMVTKCGYDGHCVESTFTHNQQHIPPPHDDREDHLGSPAVKYGTM
jgi:hypothetical protein